MAKDKKIGKCECGCTVRGIEEHGRLFTWCEKCTPVVVVKRTRRAATEAIAHRRIFRDARMGGLPSL